jgi:hypothetical protein
MPSIFCFLDIEMARMQVKPLNVGAEVIARETQLLRQRTLAAIGYALVIADWLSHYPQLEAREKRIRSRVNMQLGELLAERR